MNSNIRQEYLNISEAAKYLHVSTSTLRRWETEGKFLINHLQINQMYSGKSKQIVQQSKEM